MPARQIDGSQPVLTGVVGEEGARKAARAARELAHAASYLASEAASLARVFEAEHGRDESAAASRAAVRAAESAFRLDELTLSDQRRGAADLPEALRHAEAALEAAADSVAAAKGCVGKALAAAGVGGEAGLGTS